MCCRPTRLSTRERFHFFKASFELGQHGKLRYDAAVMPRRTVTKDNLLPRKTMVRALGSAMLAAVQLFTASAAVVQEVWVNRYDGPAFGATDYAQRVVRDPAGNIIVTGTTQDGSEAAMITTKYSGTDGAVFWSARFDGSRYDDTPRAIAVDASGNVFVAGFTYDDPNFNRDCYTAKYDGATGALLWERRYSGPQRYNDEIAAVAVDTNGDVVAAGYTTGNNFSDYFLAKYSGVNGAVLWQTNHGYYSGDQIEAVALDATGNVFVTGTAYNDFLTVKYSGVTGAVLWQKAFNGKGNNADAGRALAVDASGNVIVTGASTGAGGNLDFCTIKYAGVNGVPLWTNRYNGPANLDDHPLALALDASGNALVTGNSRNAANDDCYTAKYAAATGMLLWEQRYNGPSNQIDQAYALAVDISGNALITGQSYSGFNNSDYYTAKYAANDGAVLWERRYQSVSNSFDTARAITLDNNGDAFVTGFSGNGVDADYYTARYAAGNAAVLWEQRLDGPVNRSDIPQAVRIDSRGNVIVTGYSHTNKLGSVDADYYTAKYAAEDGKLIWERHYKGPEAGNDYPLDLALDSHDNVIVTGYSWNPTNFTVDILTAKYAAFDGAVLWENRFNGPAFSDENARAVVVDGNDDVVITGISNGRGYTAKYSGTNGAVLWEAPASDPEFGFLLAYDVAVDAAGDVFITGYSRIQGSFSVCYIAKYSGTNGMLHWEKRTAWYGEGRSVQVDGDGNAVMTGTVSRNSASFYYTAKYAGTNGALLWENVFSFQGSAEALAVDAQRNVFVTGRSYNGANADFYTIKHSGTNGVVLWARRFNGPANLDDAAKAIALDAHGDLFVAGTSLNGVAATDWSLVKYSGVDGTLLWATQFNGGGNREDILVERNCLAVGPGGRVAVAGASQPRNSHYDYMTVLYREFDVLPRITSRRLGDAVELSWPAIHQGWRLQARRNSSGTGFSTAWATVEGSTSSNSVVLPFDSAVGFVFFRLIFP